MSRFRDALTLIVLVSCVPLQYYLSNRSSSDVDGEALASSRLRSIFRRVESTLQLDHLAERTDQLVNYLVALPFTWPDPLKTPPPPDDAEASSEAKEKSAAAKLFATLKLTIERELKSAFGLEIAEAPPKEESQEEFFAASKTIRSPRPPDVHFRVGDIVEHTVQRFRGVVVGWDPIVKAPARWIEATHPADKRAEWAAQPNYAVLVDTRQRIIPQLAYVVKDGMIRLDGARAQQIFHPAIEEYFERFDLQRRRYRMRPWLKRLYPHDE